MKKSFIVCLVIAMALGFSNAYAAPSAKATAQLGDLSVLYVSGSGGAGTTNRGNSGWTTLFTQDIKTPNGKELFINVSLEAGLTTDTTVMSKKLVQAIAEAEAIVAVRVLVDGNSVPVNGNGDSDITFARRTQTLKASFAGDISSCMTINTEGSIVIDWACVAPETLQLILDTMQANSFNFIAPNLIAGTHTVKVQAILYYKAYGNLVQETIDTAVVTMAQGNAFAKAYLGNGSVTIETVRMIKDEDLVVDLTL